MSHIIATEFAPTPDKLQTILDACCDHRAWFSDFLWTDPVARREAARAHLATMFVHGKLWEVWNLQSSQLVGIIILGDIVYRTDATCHFIFFDRQLANKRDLCISLMRWAFEHMDLHRLSVEIPTYARALTKFARKLGFRYEAEGREPYQHKDERLEPLGLAKAYVGSRKYRATLYEGSWHDLLCLSLLREEFDALYGRPENNPD